MAIRSKPNDKLQKGAAITELVAQFKQTKKMKEMWDDKEKELKGRLMTLLDEQGVEDDKGHKWLELPEEVDGTVKIQKQRRLTQVLNTETAEAELKKLELWDECTREITVIDEDALLALGFQKKIPDKVMHMIYEENIVYALYLR